MKKKNIAYIISQVSHSNMFEWTAGLLDRKKYNLTFILLHEKKSHFENFLRKQGFTVYRLDYGSKYDMPGVMIRTWQILKKEKVDIVHTHLFEAGLAGMTAAKFAGIHKRIHTRHDATIHHRYHPQAVKYDRVINGLATHIVAITRNVKHILAGMEGVPANKITVIHHGFKMDAFENVERERVEALRQQYFPGGKPFPVIGVVSRFIEWKGVHYIIPAFAEIRKKHPEAHLVLANAQGPFTGEIEKLLEKLPPGSYTRIIYEQDIIALYRLFDIFVHVPVDEQCEAFGQVYIEAMAAGIPSVITLSGIAPDYVKDGVHELTVPFRDSKSIAKQVGRLLSDNSLREKISAAAKKAVHDEFQVEGMIRSLEQLYDA